MAEKGVNQSGLALDLVETGNLESLTIDTGAPPAGLTEVTAIAGSEVTHDEFSCRSSSPPTRRHCSRPSEQSSAAPRPTG